MSEREEISRWFASTRPQPPPQNPQGQERPQRDTTPDRRTGLDRLAEGLSSGVRTGRPPH